MLALNIRRVYNINTNTNTRILDYRLNFALNSIANSSLFAFISNSINIKNMSLKNLRFNN